MDGRGRRRNMLTDKTGFGHDTEWRENFKHANEGAYNTNIFGSELSFTQIVQWLLINTYPRRCTFQHPLGTCATNSLISLPVLPTRQITQLQE